MQVTYGRLPFVITTVDRILVRGIEETSNPGQEIILLTQIEVSS